MTRSMTRPPPPHTPTSYTLNLCLYMVPGMIIRKLEKTKLIFRLFLC